MPMDLLNAPVDRQDDAQVVGPSYPVQEPAQERGDQPASPLPTPLPEPTPETPSPAQNVAQVGSGGVDNSGPKRKVLYVIKDKNVGNFEVLSSPQTVWWIDRERVVNLINCFKQGYTVKQACIYAGISRDQWLYFNEVHPTFPDIKEACLEVGKMLARTGIHAHLQKQDKSVLMWYAERKMPEEFGRVLSDGGVAPNQTLNNFGTIINAPVDPTTIKPKVLARMRELEAQDNEQANKVP